VTESTLRTEHIGQFDMAVVYAEPSPEAATRWAHRTEALATWLLSEWLREHPEAA